MSDSEERKEARWRDLRRAAQDAAGALLDERRFGLVEKLYLAALAQADEIGANSLQAQISLQDLLTFYTSNEFADDPHRVMPIALRLLALQEQNLGPNDPDLIPLLDELGHAYHQLWISGEAEPSEAEAAFRRALALAEAQGGITDPQAVQLAEHLARHLLAIGNAKEAIPLWERTLAATFGTRLEDALIGLAASYRDAGDYASAALCWLRFLGRQEAVLGKNHPLLSSTLHQLALLDLRQGRAAEAEARLRQALALVRASPQFAAFDPVPLTRDLARSLQAQGRLHDAEQLYRQILAEIWSRYHNYPWDPRMPHTGRPVTREANAYRIWRVREAMAQTLEPYAQLLRDAGRDREAARIEQHVAVIRRKLVRDKNHPDQQNRMRRASGWE